MRTSKFYLFPVKEDPNDASLVSHKLMLRSCMIRQSAAGIYTWLPLGLIVLKKIEAIIRKLHYEYDIQELLMPTIQSADLWKKSERYSDYGKEMLRIVDRNKNELLYGPTNEELITDVVSKDLQSYKDFPKILYHIQWKFRDEVRPRFGVMRCREFLMKDAYSFDIDFENAYLSYCKMFLLYLKIFKKLGVKALPFEADTGPIGGSLSHEFILEASSGESEIFYDNSIHDLNIDNVDFNNSSEIKDMVLNYSKYYSRTSEKHEEKVFQNSTNEKNIIRSRGIEVGHIFYFGKKYSEKLNSTFLNDKGKTNYIFSGSYGIGISRLVAAIIESSNDDKGIVWPIEVAPFQIGLVNVRKGDNLSTEFSENFYKSNHGKYNIIYEDRDIRLGQKLNIMDLIGIPIQIIIGEKNIVNNYIEIKDRKSGKVSLVSKDKIEVFLKKEYEL
ncbi:MAG: Proline--tRNA ligase [Alphaproteobacteria bacterium MarineAlpha9_Bin4]|nr:proline--tRNA ligase [Pelagibacterales bacterium]PPR27538.1 MAG: Proline--tRNA ligase [Alphaproteobacteria bacterium MarineAlpha9_Bin4]